MKIGIISFAHKNAWIYAEIVKGMGLELVGLADDEEERGKKASEKLSVPYFPQREELLAKGLDVVFICSENAKHKDDIAISLEACKKIICEPPLTTSVEDAKLIIESVGEKKASLFLAFPYRYSPPLLRAKDILKEGRIGEVLALKATHRSKAPDGWQVKREFAGGGAILQNALPMIDVMRWLMEDEVKEVYAEIQRSGQSGIEVEDIATLALRFEKGAFATLDPSWCYPQNHPFWGDATIELVGKEGALLVNAFAQVLTYIDDKGKELSWRYWGSPLHQLMVKDYINRIEKGLEPPVPLMDGLRELEVVFAGYLSGEKREAIGL